MGWGWPANTGWQRVMISRLWDLCDGMVCLERERPGKEEGPSKRPVGGGGRDADAGPSSVGGLDLSVSVSLLFCSVERRCGEMES